jgi:hypothetical protein
MQETRRQYPGGGCLPFPCVVLAEGWDAIYESDDCAEDALVVFEMESETEAWGIGKAIERPIQVTEGGF